MPDSFPETTHSVENQAPPIGDHNAFLIDPVMREGLAREGGGWGEALARAFGARTGSEEVADWAHKANTYIPVLHTHDRWGRRIDEVEFHDSYHSLMALAKEASVHSLPWREPRPGAQVVRAVLHILFNEAEQGVSCPIAMTFAGVPALGHQPDVADQWIPRLTAPAYDRRMIPSWEKDGCTIGMAMTEKQGGSDVRANSTRASPVGKGGPGAGYLLSGHKWFCSAPMCDAFLTLAYTEKGLSCFLVPRWTPDGDRNRFFIQRLKNKLGNKSNASSEIEYDRTWAVMVGEEGRGVPTIIEMVHHTRLETSIGSVGQMRGALTQAIHHTRHRSAFQRRLSDQPLMRQVLADLALEVEAATTLILRVARAFDETASDETAAAFGRIATPIAKYWICKRVPGVVYEALECHGGNGYVEDAPMARFYREAPLNGIWEGSGNVICLDVLRAMGRNPESVQALADELAAAAGLDDRYDAHLKALQADLAGGAVAEASARLLVERIALALQACLLLRHAPPAIGAAFCETRLGGPRGQAYGAFADSAISDAVLERAFWEA